MKLSIVVPRKPVSVNAMYVRRSLRNGGKGLRLSDEAADFKESVRSHAFAAAMAQRWPKPERVKRVKLSIVVWNTKHDCSAAEKIVADALEGIVYVNDRVARPRVNDVDKDGGDPRVEITVELLEAA